MKVSIDNVELFTLTPLQKQVIQNDIPSEIFDADMKRRLAYIITQPCIRHIDRNAEAWRGELSSRELTSYPTDRWELANTVFQLRVEQPFTDVAEMVIQVDDEAFYTVTSLQKKVLFDMGERNPTEYIKEKLQFILIHKYERCLQRLRNEWQPRLIAEGMTMLPIKDEEIATLIFSHADYKNRSSRMSQETTL